MAEKEVVIRKAIFIDGSFLFHHAQSINIRIDYKKLKSFLVKDGERLVSCCYYTALPVGDDMEDKHRKFLRVLKRDVRIQVKSVPLLKSPVGGDGSRYSKGEDILLACDLVRGAILDHFDEAVMVTGDGDFVPAVKAVQEAGKRVVVAGFKKSLSNTLDMEANDVIYLEDHVGELTLQQDESGHSGEVT
jgi:uncharacterized LabA/DUF88 family protein